MKTSILKLFLSVAILLAFANISIAQVGSITVKWNDDCYPPTNNTDSYKVTLTVYRNLDGAFLCGLDYSVHNEPYDAPYSQWLLPTCYCSDVVGGYHIIANVKRFDHNGTLVCEGTTEDNISCANMTDLEIKVEMPS